MEKIDFGIRRLIKDLNQHGYETLFSCAGHKDVIHLGKNVPDEEGYVAIKGNVSHFHLIEIAQKYVDDIRIKKTRMSTLTGEHKTFVATRMSFKAKNLRKWNGG